MPSAVRAGTLRSDQISDDDEAGVPSQLCVLGAGSWGTALAIALSSRFESVYLWSHRPEHAAALASTRENRRYLPGFSIPSNVTIASELAECLRTAEVVLTVVPSAFLRTTMDEVREYLPAGAKLVSATKGVEEQTLFRMSQVVRSQLLPDQERPIAVLSGPTFAKEIASGEPAAVVIACEDLAHAEQIQRSFATPRLRFYTTPDVVGVEIGAALKNVIAIGAGICKGLGLGSNSVAALVTRGLAEITRLAVTLGGKAQTLSGLAGLGDLVLTATGDLSRNRSVGVQLGNGEPLPLILSRMSMVAEGIGTCAAAHQLGIRHQVDLPIINKMHEILYRGKDPRAAIRELMERPLRTEM